jgi:putative peptidoglycan lipid II flippase
VPSREIARSSPGAGVITSTGANPPVTLRRATTTMAVGTLLSRITGVGRIVALAYALGTGLSNGSPADAYNLSNTIPNIVQDLVLGGILSATFIPVFVARLATRAEDEAWEAISAVVSVTLVFLGAASVVFLAAAPFIVDALTVLRHTPGERTVATYLLILFVPQLACYTFAALAAALLNARGRFAAPTFAPIANNVITIAILLAFAALERHPTLAGLEANRGDLILLGLGTSAGVAVQALLLIPSLRRAGLHLHFRLDYHHEAVRTILKLSGWTFGLVVTNQVALLVVLALFDKIPGGVSAYTYSYAFFQLPYGVVAISVMSAVTPDLAARWARHDPRGFRRRWSRGLRGILAIVLPAAAGELILAKPLVAVLIGYHASNPASTTPTAQALAMLSLGLPGFCVFLYTVRAFQAMQSLRIAFWLYVLENGINIALALVLVGPLGVRGVALSISAAYTIAAVVALVVLRSRLGGLDSAVIARPFGRILLATVALVAAAAIGSNLSASETPLALASRVVLGAVFGTAAYLLVVITMGALEHRGRPKRQGGSGGSEPAARTPTYHGRGRLDPDP